MLLKLRLRLADLPTGQAATDRISASEPAPLAVTLFEDKPGFVLEAYYEGEAPSQPALAALASLDGAAGAPSLEEVPDTNWVAVSQAALPPVHAGRFIVHGSHDRARVGGRRTAIEIEAGAAFGTGHNATTTLCLNAVDRLTRRRRFHRVLDLGCGSAVLAIAAARAVPAARVIATDNDPVATEAARENVALNRVARRVRVLDAAGFNHPLLRTPQGFDLILANILPRPLVELAPRMRRAVPPGGIVVLCGLLTDQVREVRATYAMAGFRLLAARCDAGWAALILERSGARTVARARVLG